MSTADLERLLRWEGAGGTWRILTELDGSVMVSLCRCDGGEEADRFTTDDADVLEYVRTHPPTSYLE